MSPTNAARQASHTNDGLTETIRRVAKSTPVRALVVTTLLVSGLAGTGLAAEIPVADEGTTSPGSDVVEVTCSGYQVDVPAERTYYLHVHVLDESSGQTFRANGGPFTGPLAEGTDGLDITITDVEVQYESGGGASASLPGRC